MANTKQDFITAFSGYDDWVKKKKTPSATSAYSSGEITALYRAFDQYRQDGTLPQFENGRVKVSPLDLSGLDQNVVNRMRTDYQSGWNTAYNVLDPIDTARRKAKAMPASYASKYTDSDADLWLYSQGLPSYADFSKAYNDTIETIGKETKKNNYLKDVMQAWTLGGAFENKADEDTLKAIQKTITDKNDGETYGYSFDDLQREYIKERQRIGEARKQGENIRSYAQRLSQYNQQQAQLAEAEKEQQQLLSYDIPAAQAEQAAARKDFSFLDWVRSQANYYPSYVDVTKNTEGAKGELAAINERSQEIRNARIAQTFARYEGIASTPDYAAFQYNPNTAPKFSDRMDASVYDYINDRNGAQAKVKRGSFEGKSSALYVPYDYMAEDEKKLYNYLAEKQGAEAATDYLSALESRLNERVMQGVTQSSEAYAKNLPGISDVSTIATSFANPMGLAYSIGQSIKGEEIDPNSIFFSPTQFSETVRGTRAGQIEKGVGGFGGKALSLLYQTGMSFADSMAAAAATGNPTAAGAILGINAASSATRDAVQRGANNEQALLSGGLAGMAEFAFERIGLDELFKIPSKAAKTTLLKAALGQAFIVEGGEEALTEIANVISDNLVMGDKSTYETAVREYISQGMTEQEAMAQAGSDVAARIATAYIGGVMMGAPSGAGAFALGSAANRAQQRAEALLPTLDEQQTARVAETAQAAQNMGLDVDAVQTVTEAYSMAVRADAQAATKFNNTMKTASAQIAEVNADYDIMHAEIISQAQEIYDDMVQAVRAVDQRAFETAKSKYERALVVSEKKIAAAQLKTANKTEPLRSSVVEAAEGLRDNTRNIIMKQRAAQSAQGGANNGAETTLRSQLHVNAVRETGEPDYTESSRAAEAQGRSAVGGAGSTAGGNLAQGTVAAAERAGNILAGGVAEADRGQGRGSGVLEPEAAGRVTFGNTSTPQTEQALQRHAEIVQKDTGKKPNVRIVTEVPRQLAKQLQHIKNIAGINAPDVFLYESDDDYGNGWTDDTGIYVRTNGKVHPAFTYGHELGHRDASMIDAGKSVIENMTKEELSDYKAYRDAHISSPDNADIRSELIADMYGRYLYAMATGDEALENFGLSPDELQRFEQAFDEAYGNQRGTGDLEGEVIDTVSPYITTGDPEYSRVTPVVFPTYRWKSERIRAIEIEPSAIYVSQDLTNMQKEADSFLKSEMQNETVTVDELDMPVILDYRQGLRKVIYQRHGDAAYQRLLLQILPNYKQILETSKYLGRAISGKEKSGDSEFTYLVNLVKYNGGYYAVKTTLKLSPSNTIDRMHGYSIDDVEMNKIDHHPPSTSQMTQNSQSAAALSGAGGVDSISIFDLFNSVKMGAYAANLQRPQWTESKVEYSRVNFKDEYGNDLSYTVPEVRDRVAESEASAPIVPPEVHERTDRAIKWNGGERYFADITVDGKKHHLTGDSKKKVEDRAVALKKEQRTKELSSADRYYADVTIDGKKQHLTGNDKAELEKKLNDLKKDQRMKNLSRSVRNLRAASELYSQGEDIESYVNGAGDKADFGVARLLRAIYIRNGVDQGGALSVDKMNEILANSDQFKDKSAVSYGRETLTRNLEDIAPTPEEGRKLVETYVTPIRQSVGDMVRWMRPWAKKIAALKLNREESAMVQIIGENIIDEDVLRKGLTFENGKPMDAAKIIKAISVFREFYNEALEKANAVLIRNGYPPVTGRKDYFPHMGEELGDWRSFVLNVVKGEGYTLPTEMSGITDIFRPGKPWFRNFIERTGEKTDYDAVRGFSNYLSGAGRVIYLTDSIQRIRQLEASIRQKYSKYDPDSKLTADEQKKHLTNFAAQLLEYGNQLAGKKAKIDRALEEGFGRKVFAWAGWLKKRFGANAIGMNISSALTNFIPLTQALSVLSKKDFARGMQAAVSRQVRNDGLWLTSDFLTSRFGTPDALVTKPWDKLKQGARNATNFLFEGVDRFTAETIVFAKYAEGVNNGLSEEQAMKAADEFAERIMAGRSIGSVPTLMNSRTLGIISQFQLEVNNQLSFMTKDIPRSAGGDKKKIIKAFVQMFLYAFLYNELMEKYITGRRPAFDPIGTVVNAVEDFSDKKFGDAVFNLGSNVIEQLPFGNILTGGGRIPLADAIEGANPLDAIKQTLNGEDASGAWESWGTAFLSNFVAPAGGGQIRKTIQGATAYSKEGRYIGDRLAYPVEQNGVNFFKILLNGPSAVAPQGYDYSTDILSKKQTEQYQHAVEQGIEPMDAYNLLKDMDAQSNPGALASIAGLDSDNDGKPDLSSRDMNIMAAVLGIKIPQGKTVPQQARDLADEYIKDKRKDKNISPEKKAAAEDYYQTMLRILGMKGD